MEYLVPQEEDGRNGSISKKKIKKNHPPPAPALEKGRGFSNFVGDEVIKFSNQAAAFNSGFLSKYPSNIGDYIFPVFPFFDRKEK